MSEPGLLAAEFERSRPHLTAVAYGMLGSVSEAEDAVQQAWLRLGRSDADAINDMRAWLAFLAAAPPRGFAPVTRIMTIFSRYDDGGELMAAS
jgi:Sigma-70 region 2